MTKVLPEHALSDNLRSDGFVHERKFVDTGKPIALRINEGKASGMIGHCHRNAISGKPILQDAVIQSSDWCVLDLWERHALYGQPDELAHDPYVFKIVPLEMRTWMYHELFDKPELLTTKAFSEHAIMEHVLAQKVVDCGRIAGRWSPAICCVPAAFIASFARDWWAAWALCFMCFFNLSASKLLNTPRWFGLNRLITFIPRVILFSFLVFRMVPLSGVFPWYHLFESLELHMEDKGALEMFWFAVILILLSADFLAGDGMVIYGWGWRCHYQVIRVLPQRIFVCRKIGAAFVPDPEAGRTIHEGVTGVSFFDELTMIAEVRGMVVQLKPMDKQDWIMAWDERTLTDRPISFIGLDVFNKERCNVQEIDRLKKAETAAGAAEALKEKLQGKKEPELLE